MFAALSGDDAAARMWRSPLVRHDDHRGVRLLHGDGDVVVVRVAMMDDELEYWWHYYGGQPRECLSHPNSRCFLPFRLSLDPQPPDLDDDDDEVVVQIGQVRMTLH